MVPLEIEIYDRDPKEKDASEASLQANSSVALKGPLGVTIMRVDEEDEIARIEMHEAVPVHVTNVSSAAEIRVEGNKYILRNGDSLTFTSQLEEFPKIKLTKTAPAV